MMVFVAGEIGVGPANFYMGDDGGFFLEDGGQKEIERYTVGLKEYFGILKVKANAESYVDNSGRIKLYELI